MYDILAFVLASTATTGAAAKKHLEDVHGRLERALAHAALFERLLAAAVVQLALLRIAQYLIRIRNLLELLTNNH